MSLKIPITLSVMVYLSISGAEWPVIISGDSVSISAVGDIMPGSDYPSEYYLPPGRNCAPLFEQAQAYLKSSDIVFGNLEGTFAGNHGTAKQCKHCFAFRMPEAFAACLSEAGFNLLSLANNHAMDFGAAGYQNTRQVLQKQNIQGYGLKGAPPVIITVRSQRIGFYAFSYNPGFHNIRDIDAARQLIKDLSGITDIIVVSFHGGAEGSDYQHVPGNTEYFLGENRGDVMRFSHEVINAGADLVLGHGPHVPRGVELYNGRLIVYSLGNFCTYGRFNIRGPNGIAPLLRICLNHDGTFLFGEIVPFVQEGRGKPVIDDQGRAIAKFRELTAADFPETNLDITPEGWISIKNP